VVIGVARTAEMAPVRRYQGLSCILFHPAPMDPQQDTAKTSSQVGGTSGKTYLRKGGKMSDTQRRREKQREH